MAETSTATPLRVRSAAAKPMRRMFVSLSSRLKPRPLERLGRTMSPSRTSTRPNLALSCRSTISVMVFLPAPERPVNHRVNPRPYLAPYSISILLFVLFLVHSGLLDELLLVAQALDED